MINIASLKNLNEKMKKLVYFVWISIIGSVLFSCINYTNYPKELEIASCLMDVAPDNALKIIESISNPSALEGKALADYALLYSQACDRNQIFPTNDSLILKAVDYYSKQKDDWHASLSYFYLGCIYRNGDRSTLAVEAFYKALQRIPQGEWTKLRMQIYYNLAERYYLQSLYKEALDMYQDCLGEIVLMNDSSLHYFPYYRIGQCFMSMKKYDSTLYYYQKALDNSRSFHGDDRTAIVLSDMSSAYFYKKDTVKALDIYEYLARDYIDVYSIYWKSQFLYLKKELDSAQIYLEEGLQSGSVYTKASCFDLLSKIKREEGKHALAYAYIDSFNVYRDSINVLKLHEEIQKQTINHELALQAKENESKNKLESWKTRLSMLCMLLAGGIFFIYMRKRHKEELLKRECLYFKDQSQHIHSYLNEKLGEETSLEDITTFKQGKIQIGIKAFQRTRWKIILEKVDEVINPGDYIKQGQEELYMELLFCFRDFRNDFLEIYPHLNEEDLLFCILSALHFRKRLICYCMKTTSGALRARKNRLKRNLAEDTFQMIFENHKMA